jgi:hypothetical protein
MATDLNGVRNSLIAVARTAIGSRLSQVPGPNSTTLPAIIKEFKKGHEPDFPFASISIQARRRQGLDTMTEFLDEDFMTQFVRFYDYFVSFTVFGSDAMELAGDLEVRFCDQTSIAQLKEDNVYLVDTQDIILSSELRGEDYISIATFNMIVTVPDLTETDLGCFDSMTLNGELYRDQDDPDPTTFNFEV